MNFQPPLSQSQAHEISNPPGRQGTEIAMPSLRSQLEIPFVHKWLILKCTLAGMLIGMFLIAIWPRTYASEGQLIIRVGRESVALDPTATLGSQTLLLQKTRNEEVNSALGILGSRRVFEGAVSKIGAEHILNGSFGTDNTFAGSTEESFSRARKKIVTAIGNTLETLGLRDRSSDKEKAIKKLKESVDISAPRESAVISIKALANSPEMAQAIVRSVIDIFIQQHAQVSRTPGSYEFFKKETKKTEAELNELLEERTAFLIQNDLISLSSNRTILQQQLTVNTNQLLEAEGQLKQTQAEIKHGTISTIQRQRTRVEGLKSLIEEKKSQLKAIAKAINDLAKMERILNRLESEIALKEATLNNLGVKLEEARVIDEMGRDEISNVSVFQPPTLMERPVSPQKVPIAALFTVLGLAAGLAGAYARETDANTLRTVEHVVARTGMKPIYPIQKNRQAKRLRRTARKPAKDFEGACKSILNDMLFPQNWAGKGSVGVIGCSAGCGVSSVAASLSFVSSQIYGVNTTLVDADFTRQSLSRAFGLSCSPGFAELIQESAEPEECLQKKEAALSLVSFSSCLSHKGWPGGVEAVVSTVSALRANSDLLILDLPPAWDYPEAIGLARELDYVVVVIESEKTTSERVFKLLQYLKAGRCQLSGMILNKVKQHTPRWLNFFVSTSTD